MAYNGWTNYETWLVNIWFGDSAAEHFADEEIKPESIDVRTYVEDFYNVWETKTVEDGFLRDVVNSFMDRVDWQELADHYTEEEL